MTPIFRLRKCTSLANRLMVENKPFRLLQFGCKRPNWWFSAIALLAVACYGQQYPQQRRQPNGRGGVPRSASSPAERQVHPTFEGDVKSISKKELFISQETGNGLKFRITGKTEAYDGDKSIKLASLHTGQHVAVEAQMDIDGSYNAVIVRLKAAASPQP